MLEKKITKTSIFIQSHLAREALLLRVCDCQLQEVDSQRGDKVVGLPLRPVDGLVQKVEDHALSEF